MKRLGTSALALFALVSPPVPAQTTLKLQDVNTRSAAPDFKPAHLSQKVSAIGIVNAHPFHFPSYSLLTMESGDYGAVVKVMDTRLDAFSPGDEIQVDGTIEAFNGIAVIMPEKIVKIGAKPPPAPLELSVSDLQSNRYLGRLVRTELRIAAAAREPANGAYLGIESSVPYGIFLPRAMDRTPSLSGFAKGDTVQVTGVAYQYCQLAPFNRNYQLLVNKPGDLVRKDRNLPPLPLAVALGVILLFGFFLWSRERRLRSQRETLRKTYELGEQILGASSAESILKTIARSLPAILGITRVQLYTYNRAAKTLDEVAEDTTAQISISLSSPPGGTQAGAVACFHYRTLLVIPDIDRSPFPLTAGDAGTAPRSLLFVPMFAQGEVIGVLELDQDDRVRDFSADEQELAQHLGNQIGVAIRLLDQRSVQEQLFRTEKLAAVGRLISGVVNELQTPLASISELALRAVERMRSSAAEREIAAIAAEAKKAAGMVARLVSFAAAEQGEARPVSIGGLLRTLIEFREGDWKASGIRVRDLTTREPMFVLGSQGQLEQVFLNLFVHAEQSLAEAPQKTITIRTSVLAKRLLVEIAFSAPSESRKPEETAAVLGVTRSVIAGHGGEVRLIDKNNADPRFEVELPVTVKDRSGATLQTSSNGHVLELSRRMTALVIEPDEAAQRQILALLTTRGFRVVPVENSDTGLDMAQRMRFDAAFCSVHAPGLNWVELSERMQSRVEAFVLLSDGYDSELCADFEDDERFVLAKPVQEPELERVLRSLEPSVPSIRHGVA
ncbi:MAG TPA: GAF domain-containing protein [Bryobacteraceae bacterium]|nr:GAF domain-containing protein [Bryobacteraceae bacterium]